MNPGMNFVASKSLERNEWLLLQGIPIFILGHVLKLILTVSV